MKNIRKVSFRLINILKCYCVFKFMCELYVGNFYKFFVFEFLLIYFFCFVRFWLFELF